MRHSERRKSWLRGALWPAVHDAFSDWFQDGAPRWSAALAYYALFSFIPLVGLALWIAGLVWHGGAVRQEVFDQLAQVLGAEDTARIREWIGQSPFHGGGAITSTVGLAVLLFGATGVFTSLRAALNAVWEVENAGAGGVWGFVRNRLFAFLVIGLISVLMVVSLAASTVIESFGRQIQSHLPLPLPVVRAGELLLTLVLLWLLFSLIFKWIPDAVISWRDVWVGGAVTSTLFVAGKLGIGVYLGHSDPGSSFGAAGAVVVLLLWFYYSAMIFLLGAELTQVYARRWGSRIRPEEEESAAG